MKLGRLLVFVLAGGILIAACGSDPPPPPPEPQGPSEEELARMRADSIAEVRERERAAREAEARREAEEARRRAVAEARETLEAMVFFDYDESDIRPDEEQTLRRKVDILRASPNVRMRLEGHADERGSTEYNLALGQRRAESAKAFLTGFGLDESRFTTISYGEERPLRDGSNEEAWQMNRRVEFVITAGANQINPPRTDDEDR